MSEQATHSALHAGRDAKWPRVMRTQLGQVRGLGAAHGGTRHWWAQRLTAVALVPLVLWFIASILHLVATPRATVAHWMAHPVNAALLAALVIATFHHMQLGLQVVIEDYVHHDRARMALLLLVKAAAAMLALFGLFAVVKMAFSG